MGELLAVAALSMFASNIIVSKIGAGRIALDAGYLIAVSVNVLASALLLAVDMAVRHRVPTWDGIGVLLFMGAGLFATYFGRWFILESIARLGPAKASAFQVSSPLFTAAIAWVALGERIGAVAVLGIVTAIAGLLLVSLPSGARRQPPRGDGAATGRVVAPLARSGLVLGIGSSAAYAMGNVFRGAAIRQWNELVLGVLIGALTGLALQLAFGKGRRELVRSLVDGRSARRPAVHRERRAHHRRPAADRRGDGVHAGRRRVADHAVHAAGGVPRELLPARQRGRHRMAHGGGRVAHARRHRRGGAHDRPDVRLRARASCGDRVTSPARSPRQG